MRIIILVMLIFISGNLHAQNVLPEISLKNIEGEQTNIKDLTNDGLFIVSFWATWCASCLNELDEMNDIYEDWQEKTKVKLIAISTDDSRTVDRVIPLVNGKGWNFDILFDPNQELKRNLNIGSIPYLMIIHDGKIVYSNSGYAPGQEDEIFEELLKYVK